MIKYYPLTRIKQNLYTRGTAFKLPNGKPYTGRYYVLYDGKAFTGANPVVGTNELLSPINTSLDSSSPTIGANTSIAGNFQFNEYNAAKTNNTQTTSESNLVELKPFYPVVVEADYQLGYFTRYFAKNVTGPGYIIEISQNDFANVSNGAYATNVLAYEVTSLLWQLTGPLKDTRVSQYQIKGGVYDTNLRVTTAKSVGFRGLVEYIGGDYTKFARITP